jgi:hypothetical protein
MLQGKESSPLWGFIFFFKWLCWLLILYLPNGRVFRWWLFSCWFVPMNVFLLPDIYFILHRVLISWVKWLVPRDAYCFLFSLILSIWIPKQLDFHVTDPLFAFKGWFDRRKSWCSSYRWFTTKQEFHFQMSQGRKWYILCQFTELPPCNISLSLLIY